MPDLSRRIDLKEADLQIVIQVSEAGQVYLLHCSATPFDNASLPGEKRYASYPLVEVQLTGEDRDDHHDVKHTGSVPGKRLVYVTHSEETSEAGRLFSLGQRDPVTGLEVTTHLRFFNGLPVVRAWTSLLNGGSQPVGVEYASSFALTGLVKETKQSWEETARLYVPHNTWCEEFQWRSYRLPELGLSQLPRWKFHSQNSFKRLSYQSTGTWSTSQFLPVGVIENTVSKSATGWQIESNGGWQWEVSDLNDQLYLRLSGPTDQEHQWWKKLGPGERFESVPVAVAVAAEKGPGDFSAFEQVMQSLTRYRRQIRRPNADNENLPVIFNDYMNALMGDPTTEKELPLIEAAAKAGCEVYCIDAGWYAERDRSWWDTVGDWQPSATRFPGGLGLLTQAIREHGMVPGMWLELEVMGVNNPKAGQLSDDWFFCRHGKRVIDHGRYQFDFRNPAVRAYADSVVDRLINDFGIGYFKMDYNINAGVGTDFSSDGPGDGLLEHTRSYLGWLESVFERYPGLVIENCSSGGMRLDYALLQRHSIQSTSDQMDYRRNALIAAAAPSGVTPEQGAVWAYPLKEAGREEVIYNMVNALLGRIHLSGGLSEQTPEGTALIGEAITLYKTTLRNRLKEGVPIWPLGLPALEQGWTSLGLVCGEGTGEIIYLAVWRLHGENEMCRLPLPQLKAQKVEVSRLYPAEDNKHDERWKWEAGSGALEITLNQAYSARLFQLRY